MNRKQTTPTQPFRFEEGDSFIAWLAASGEGSDRSAAALRMRCNDPGKPANIRANSVRSIGESTFIRGQLGALCAACESIPIKARLEVRTSLDYIVKLLNKYLEQWSKSDWIKSDGKPIANADLVKRIHSVIQDRNIIVCGTHVSSITSADYAIIQELQEAAAELRKSA